MRRAIHSRLSEAAIAADRPAPVRPRAIARHTTPSLVGRRLTLSPFLVFLALVFWTWLWGPIGAFLAVPLLIVSIVILGHVWPQEEMNLPG